MGCVNCGRAWSIHPCSSSGCGRAWSTLVLSLEVVAMPGQLRLLLNVVVCGGCGLACPAAAANAQLVVVVELLTRTSSPLLWLPVCGSTPACDDAAQPGSVGRKRLELKTFRSRSDPFVPYHVTVPVSGSRPMSLNAPADRVRAEFTWSQVNGPLGRLPCGQP